MLMSRRLARSGQLAAACAIACAILCASVSAVVLFAAMLDQREAAVDSMAAYQPPLISAPACGDQRARDVLAANAGRDVHWRGGDSILRWGEWRVVVGPSRLPVRVLVAAILPGAVALQVDSVRTGSTRRNVDQRGGFPYGGEVAGQWTIDDAPLSARLAVGTSLPSALEASTTSVDQLMAKLPLTSQLLSERGAVDAHICGQRALREPGTRDRRLAIGTRSDGSALFVLAHFDGVGDASASAPLGVSLPELASIMRALGAQRASVLATGASAQLMVRESSEGVARRWAGDVGSPRGLLIQERRATPRVNAGDLVSRP